MPPQEPLNNSNQIERQRVWGDFRAHLIVNPNIDTASSPAESLTPFEPREVIHQDWPTSAQSMARLLRTCYHSSPTAPFLGIPVGEWFKQVRVRLRPQGIQHEVQLATLMRQAYPCMPELHFQGQVARLRKRERLPLPQVSTGPNTNAASPNVPLLTTPAARMEQAGRGVRQAMRPQAYPKAMIRPLFNTCHFGTGKTIIQVTRDEGATIQPMAIPLKSFFGAAPSLGRRVPRPGWLMFDAQIASYCAIYVLNHIMQAEFPWFSVADIREGAELVRTDDAIHGTMAPIPHDTAGGDFSSEAIGRALGRRYFDWCGVQLVYGQGDNIDEYQTVETAFGMVPHPNGGRQILGIFVHQGAYYTGMIRRNGQISHIDSLAGVSGDGNFVCEVSPAH